MSQRRALLLVNPRARQGTAVEAAVARLTAGGIAVRPETFSAGTEAADDIARLATDADLVVIAGGDGTLSRSAGALLKTGLPLGILPTGTANDLARTLELPTNLVAAADVIVAGRRRRIDVGSVNDCTFFNVATIGLGVDLAHTLDSDLKRRWGRLSYAIAAAKVMMRARPFRAWIRENGMETKVRTLQVAVGNGRFYGGGTVVEENAAIDDGHLDLYSLEFESVLKLALMMRAFRTGGHGAWDDVRSLKGLKFEIRTRKPRKVNADGELVTETPALFKIHPAALEVFTP